MTAPHVEALSDNALWLIGERFAGHVGTVAEEVTAWVDAEQARRAEEVEVTRVQDAVEASGRTRPTRAVARVMLRHHGAETAFLTGETPRRGDVNCPECGADYIVAQDPHWPDVLGVSPQVTREAADDGSGWFLTCPPNRHHDEPVRFAVTREDVTPS